MAPAGLRVGGWTADARRRNSGRSTGPRRESALVSRGFLTLDSSVRALRRSRAETFMTDESDDIQETVDRVRRGDQHALAALFSRHRDRLRRMVEFRLDARLRGR